MTNGAMQSRAFARSSPVCSRPSHRTGLLSPPNATGFLMSAEKHIDAFERSPSVPVWLAAYWLGVSRRRIYELLGNGGLMACPATAGRFVTLASLRQFARRRVGRFAGLRKPLHGLVRGQNEKQPQPRIVRRLRDEESFNGTKEKSES